MKFVAAVLALFLVGCSEWVPEEFPVKVDLGDMSEEQELAVIEACDQLNAEVGSAFLKPVSGNGRAIQRGRIHVDSDKPNPGMAATAFHTPWSCKIALGKSTAHVGVIKHELLHCLGIEHSDNPADLMFEGGPGSDKMSQADLEYVRDLVGMHSSL